MKRREGRELAVQCLYLMEMNNTGLETALNAVLDGELADSETVEPRPDEEMLRYVRFLVEGTLAHVQEIDCILGKYLTGWRLERLSRVDKQIMRMSAFEMLHEQDMPPKVAINEAIDLAKHFGTEESGKFVNGVLGKMIKELDQIKTL